MTMDIKTLEQLIVAKKEKELDASRKAKALAQQNRFDIISKMLELKDEVKKLLELYEVCKKHEVKFPPYNKHQNFYETDTLFISNVSHHNFGFVDGDVIGIGWCGGGCWGDDFLYNGDVFIRRVRGETHNLHIVDTKIGCEYFGIDEVERFLANFNTFKKEFLGWLEQEFSKSKK